MTEDDKKSILALVRQSTRRGHNLGEAYTRVAERTGFDREDVVTIYLRATASPIFQ